MNDEHTQAVQTALNELRALGSSGMVEVVERHLVALQARLSNLQAALQSVVGDDSPVAYEREFDHEFGHVIRVFCASCGQGQATEAAIQHDVDCIIRLARKVLEDQ